MDKVLSLIAKGESQTVEFKTSFQKEVVGKLYGGLSVEQLLSGNYSSQIRNIAVARAFKEAGIIEQYGSGIARIQEECKKNGNATVKFEEFQHGFRITINKKSNVGVTFYKGGSMGGSIELTSRQQEIITIIKANNKIGYRSLAEKLNINDSAVKKHLNNLKDKGVLKRVGGTRGYWEIIDE